jgi:hypothetical protein
MNSKNQKKGELISRLVEFKSTQPIISMVELLDCLIEETRIDNDTARGDFIISNQGKIAAFRQLKDIVEKGLPGGVFVYQDAPEN